MMAAVVGDPFLLAFLVVVSRRQSVRHVVIISLSDERCPRLLRTSLLTVSLFVRGNATT